MNKFSKCTSLLGTGITKWFAIDSISPLFILPMLISISTVHIYLSILVIFLALPALLCHIYLIFRFSLHKKKFFYIWSITSMVFVFISFEILIVPLMVISPSENVLFYVLFCCIITCARQMQKNSIRINAKINSIYHRLEENQPFISAKKPCTICCIRMSDSTSLCNSCQISTLRKNHYNAWIYCSVGRSNRKQYWALLFFSLLWLVYTSYLILTTICDSHLMFNRILIPSDCSNVYVTMRSAVCFVSVLYSIEIVAFITVMLTRECCGITK